MIFNTPSTQITQLIKAPRPKVYEALVTAATIQKWKVPPGMQMHIHEFEGREGGKYRISLTYDAPDRTGKTSGHTDTYHGRFVKLLPNEQVVEEMEFETNDPALKGKMKTTIKLVDADGGTELRALHEGLPPGVSAADNELGWQQSLGKLAAVLEKAEK